AMRGMFEAAGYEIVDFKEMADVYVVNTCTVTNIADRKSRQMLHQAKSRNPKAIIAAVGCYVQAAEEVLVSDNAVDLVVGNNKKSDIVSMVERCKSSKNKEELVVNINDEIDYEELNVITTMEKTRAFIKIQDGCNRFCSYCIIPYVRGRVRSRKEEEVLQEISELVKKGYQEIVLTGIHISSYGTDFMKVEAETRPSEQENCLENMPLAELITKISKIDGVERIRLGSLEPRIITEEFLAAISQVRQFCPHFHLSLQSGSDTVLKRMNRKYSADEYYNRVIMIQKYFELPSFTTDIIVGFPGETQEEFNETIQFVKKIGFFHIHVFKYSKRAGTKAADMPNQISEEMKNHRSNELIAISEIMSQEYKACFWGKIEKVLFEDKITIENKIYQVGHNERYLKIAVQCNNDLSNQIHQINICNNLTEEILLCEIIH
ncbi:MAG: tRNA (N(6)-L-threonylcarbamoyladenosine(37)-C(2))-methylthiotransferase MtaB, partial [Herbinix sp.]|nr:tRNA (N(6)-L-threonylcarbamoyladenosine(37)-C(2))-methylthiotransferase MtaB [Herbinix sp.]